VGELVSKKIMAESGSGEKKRLISSGQEGGPIKGEGQEAFGGGKKKLEYKKIAGGRSLRGVNVKKPQREIGGSRH